MYGPKPQKHVDPLAERTIPRYYQCSHTHVSGRHCKRVVTTPKAFCEQCKPVQADYCAECMSMLKAFGL